MQMRRQAVGLVQGLTGSPEGTQTLASASNELLPALLWLVGDSSQVSRAALTSLVNLSQVIVCSVLRTWCRCSRGRVENLFPLAMSTVVHNMIAGCQHCRQAVGHQHY